MLRALLVTKKDQVGASLVEALLAIAVFGLLVMGVAGAIIYGQQSTSLAGQNTRAAHIAAEGVEAVRSIRDNNFNSLIAGTYGLAISGGKWTLVGTPDVVDGLYTRTVVISSVDATTVDAKVAVSWQQNPQRTGSTDISARLTNWRVATSSDKGGVLVYANGGRNPGTANTDTILYKTFSSAGAWSVAANVADVDASTSNRTPLIVKLYTSPTRNEKVLISKHYDNSVQYIYAQVYNGTTWGNVQLLSSWTAGTFLDNNNFDGAYMSQNGNFMTVFSDGTTSTPRYRIWDGANWSAQNNLSAVTNIPNWIVTRNRPGTNEIMYASLDRSNDTFSIYWNGTSWGTATSHAINAQANNRKLLDFTWSPNNPLIGLLVFSDKTNDKSPAGKIINADGLGGVAYGAKVNTPNIGNNTGTIATAGRNGVTEFQYCIKDQATSPISLCFKVDSAGVVTTPTNNTLASAAPTTNQITFGHAFESQANGNLAINLFSDNTTTPKYKKFNPSTNTWDAAGTNLATTLGTLQSAVLIPNPVNNDIMMLLNDANGTTYSLHSEEWDGSIDAPYTTPAGRARNTHSSNGPGTIYMWWYDFNWDVL